MTDLIRVLVVDDSAMFRRLMAVGLSRAEDIVVVGTAGDADEARVLIERHNPDVITLDIELPGECGITLLRETIAKGNAATLVISSKIGKGVRLTIEALEAGAQEVISKPRLSAFEPLGWTTLHDTIRQTLAARRNRKGKTYQPIVEGTRKVSVPVPKRYPDDWLIAIGASTGGVQALSVVLPTFPRNAPPVVIVQHMPAGFTGAFARRLNTLCQIEVREARDGDILHNGLCLIAPGGDQHMIVDRRGAAYVVRLVDGEEVCFSRPSVDVMFQSVARTVRTNSVAGLLTGMGRDGAQGLSSIRKAGGRTFSQDETSCSVYGMPAAAKALGATEAEVPLVEMAQHLLNAVGTAPASGRKNTSLTADKFDAKGMPQ